MISQVHPARHHHRYQCHHQQHHQQHLLFLLPKHPKHRFDDAVVAAADVQRVVSHTLATATVSYRHQHHQQHHQQQLRPLSTAHSLSQSRRKPTSSPSFAFSPRAAHAMTSTPTSLSASTPGRQEQSSSTRRAPKSVSPRVALDSSNPFSPLALSAENQQGGSSMQAQPQHKQQQQQYRGAGVRSSARQGSANGGRSNSGSRGTGARPRQRALHARQGNGSGGGSINEHSSNPFAT